MLDVLDSLDEETLLNDPQTRAALALLESSLYTFEPRPDRPEIHDEQAGFVASRSKVSICRGGTGSGKTEAAAQKTARFLLWDQAPPRFDTPFWVVSDSYQQVMEICWKEKLARIIPRDCVDWARIQWFKPDQEWPFRVPLKPWPGNPHANWVLEFKSIEQGRGKLQGRSIGGFWFSEQFPFEIFEECLGRCRDYWFDGGQIAEFTPLDPNLSAEFEIREDDPPVDWQFFRLNSQSNTATSDTWKKSYFSSVSQEQKETRLTGAYGSYVGQIYQTFNNKIHVLTDKTWAEVAGAALPDFPAGVFHRRGIDWGESHEHPFVCLWGFRNGSGQWFIYDELVDDAAMLYQDRRKEIKKRWPWPKSGYHGQTYADPSRPGLINEFNCDGISTQPASNSIDNGIECVRRLLQINEVTEQPSLFIYGPNCLRLVKSLRSYRWKRSSGVGINPAVARREPLKRDDDPADALRYMLYSESQWKDIAPSSQRTERDFTRHGVYGVRR